VNRRHFYCWVIFTVFVSVLAAQKSKVRFEYIGSIGYSTFLGDLGGANSIGTHLIKDIDIVSTRPILSAGIRYKRHPIVGFKGMCTIGMLRGDDKWTEDIYRNNRNLNFRAPFVELTGQAEFYLIKERAPKLYSFKSIGKKKKNIAVFGFVGAGVLFFVPQGKYNGKWYNLRPLSTEGQGLPGGVDKYSLFTVVFPYGIGAKYGLNKKISVSAEIGLRFTFSDYIDDVSTSYYDKAQLKSLKGDLAVSLADPSLGNIYGASSPDASGKSAQRGNPKDKDSYSFVQFSASYKIFKARKKRTRSKF
jgi:hypothetical protein